MHPHFSAYLARQRREALLREAAQQRRAHADAPSSSSENKSPLRHPAFRRLWSGLTVSRMGDQFTIVALTWFVLQLTGSGIAIGLLVLCFQLPTIVSSPLMGKLLDRYQPRLIMSIDNFGRACIIAAIPLLYWSGALHLWMVYGLALCAGMLSPATEVGVRVVVPRLVAWKELERANALTSISWDAATLVGPAFAGFLVFFINAPSVLIIDAATFLFMGTMALAIPGIQHATQVEAQASGRKTLLGFGSIFSIRAAGFLSLLTLLFLFAQGLTEVVIPVYSQRALHAGPAGYGLLMSAFGAGSLLALALLSRRDIGGNRQGITLALILLCSGALLAPLMLVRALPLALLVMGLAGLAAAPYYVVEQSLMQRLVPGRLRGQVFGARGALNVAGYPLGGALGGLLLGVMAAPLVIGIPALLCVLVGCACLCLPAIRGLRREVMATP